jgi:hypothetical protein
VDEVPDPSAQPFNARALQARDRGSPLEVVPPVLFNTYKHHAGALRVRIGQVVRGGADALAEAARQTPVLGTKLMDLYTGQLSPHAISQKVVDLLRAEGRLEPCAYREWLRGQGGYAVVTFPEDGSRWVLRPGDNRERYVHLHPGRWSPATVRVRANVIKTAFLVLAHAGIHGADPMDRAVIDAVRAEHLGLPPLGRDPEGEAGLGALIGLLRGERA